jgi:hypothetical protein
MIPGAAVASANSTKCSYSKLCQVHNVSASKSPSGSQSNTSPVAASQTTTGSLPFTGLDLAALAVGGVVLLGAGLMLRRVSATERR